jgi:hypothetical protein
MLSGFQYESFSVSTAWMENRLWRNIPLRISRLHNTAGGGIMKSGTKDKAKLKIKERLEKPMKDPTLEGKDENKVGRIQEKS